MAVAIPFIAMAASAGAGVMQGAQQSDALKTNSVLMGYEGKVASAQGYQAEATQRRLGTMRLGSATAAAGQSGAGYGGSTGRALKQSALDAELDALNIRYKAQLQKWGYSTQSQILSSEASTAASQGTLRAGASLLTGYAHNYLGADLGG